MKAFKMMMSLLAAVLWASVASAGEIVPNEGAVFAMGCNGGDGLFASTSQGLGCRKNGYTITRQVALEMSRCEKGHHDDDCAKYEEIYVPGEDWDYWMPITDVNGTVTLEGNVLKVQGYVRSETEQVGINDRMLILAMNGSTATVLYRQNILTIVLQIDPDTGAVNVGSEYLGYFATATGL